MLGLGLRRAAYITTPIFYVNARPHIGHSYSALVADTLARWRRLKGERTFFLTGTDEHGSKIQEAASGSLGGGRVAGAAETLRYCDGVAEEFKKCFNKIDVKYDRFIRTTEESHKNTVEALWNKLYGDGFITKGSYAGWYSVSDESFVPKTQVVGQEEYLANLSADVRAKTNWKTSSSHKVNAETGQPVEWVEEDSYVFEFTPALCKEIREWLVKGDAVSPKFQGENLLPLLEDLIEKKGASYESLRHLSVTRPSSRVSWGIRVPNDPNNTIYVWLDALSNYISALGWPHDMNSFSQWWPAEVQVVGKDIIRFHALYWPAFLLAAGLPLPKKIICHSHWTINGTKMSKSLGNVVDTDSLVDLHGVDPVRFYLMKSCHIAHDSRFSFESLLSAHEQLANVYGNLLMRSTSNIILPSNTLPSPTPRMREKCASIIELIESTITSVDLHFAQGEIGPAVDAVIDLLLKANVFFHEKEPWKLVKNSDLTAQETLTDVLYVTLEILRISSILLLPVIPTTAGQALSRLGVPESDRLFDKIAFGRTPGTLLGNATAGVLVPKLPKQPKK